ncbi:uncharacterized protein LOC130182516 [Seriola aureovittata]|uniref:uncharacterized protein LOC130182516 n=1 Tax=Seriola aureovittata TaxID=2871759 RepID=UPI0024BE8F29|nr:uncharacterized protein LOC130182516 [Seriola aureovittata]
MMFLVQLLMMMMMMMLKSEAAVAEFITVSAQSGQPVLLSSPRVIGGVEQGWDVRWTCPPHLVLSLKKNMTTCHRGRCELLRDGSLTFSRVQASDSGNYSLQVFNQSGKLQVKTDFLLRVEESPQTDTWLICCLLLLLLLLLFILLFILRKRRIQRRRITGPMEENFYVSMHGHHGNKRKDEEEKGEREEESAYVPHHRTVSMETPITQQMSEEAQDIYV